MISIDNKYLVIIISHIFKGQTNENKETRKKKSNLFDILSICLSTVSF